MTTPSKFSRQNEDLISNVPEIVANKILELLPIRMAARISLLSKHWRSTWLSLQRLNFNDEFCEELKNEDGTFDSKKCSNIISSILIHHNGHVHEFNLYIPSYLDEEEMPQCLNLSQWLRILSRNAVKRITLGNSWECFHLSSYIFSCSELVSLELDNVVLDPLPNGFSGFQKLQRLMLRDVYFSKKRILHNLIAKCPVLATLKVDYCGGISHIFIEARSLETLIINDELTLRDARNLKSTSLCLYQLECCIQFGGSLCKHLATAKIPRPLPVTLNKLYLGDLNVGDFRVVNCVFGMIKSCPSIKELKISVVPKSTAQQHEITRNTNQRLDHLIHIKISGITGTNAELKFIEYVLGISVVLETLVFKYGRLNTELELKLSKALLSFSKASTKARLIVDS